MVGNESAFYAYAEKSLSLGEGSESNLCQY